MSAGEIISAHGLPTADTSNVYRVTQSSDASISIIMKGWRGSNNARRGNEQASGKKIDIPVKNVQRQPAARTFARVHMSVHVYGFVCEECRLESLKRLQANILHSLPSQFHRNCARSWPLVYPRARYFPVTFLIQFLLIYNLHHSDNHLKRASLKRIMNVHHSPLITFWWNTEHKWWVVNVAY